LLDKINAYADRRTLLAPRHITQLAEALCEHPTGCNWTTTFLKRLSDRIASKYWRVQELARLKADTTTSAVHGSEYQNVVMDRAYQDY